MTRQRRFTLLDQDDEPLLPTNDYAAGGYFSSREPSPFPDIDHEGRQASSLRSGGDAGSNDSGPRTHRARIDDNTAFDALLAAQLQRELNAVNDEEAEDGFPLYGHLHDKMDNEEEIWGEGNEVDAGHSLDNQGGPTGPSRGGTAPMIGVRRRRHVIVISDDDDEEEDEGGSPPAKMRRVHRPHPRPVVPDTKIINSETESDDDDQPPIRQRLRSRSSNRPNPNDYATDTDVDADGEEYQGRGRSPECPSSSPIPAPVRPSSQSTRTRRRS